MSASVEFGVLRAWLLRQRGFPSPCADPFAALLAHYGRRLDRPDHEEALRHALIKFLDVAVALAPRDDFDLVTDAAQVLLVNIETRRGGIWPIEAPDVQVGDGEIGEGGHSEGYHHATTLQVERGLGSSPVNRGITDDNLLLLLAVLIVATEKASQAKAAEVVVDVLLDLGLSVPRESAPGGVSRTKTTLRALLSEPPSAAPRPGATLNPARVRQAYAELAERMADDALVVLPRAPDGLEP